MGYAIACHIPFFVVADFFWDIPFSTDICQFQVHSRCGKLKSGYPKVPKYDKIAVVEKKWDIPHIPELPNIPKNNVLPL